MAPTNSGAKMIGKTYRVIDYDGFTMLLEEDDGSGVSSRKFTLLEAKSIDSSVDHGSLEIVELKRG